MRKFGKNSLNSDQTKSWAQHLIVNLNGIHELYIFDQTFIYNFIHSTRCAYYKQTKGSMAHVPAVWNSGLNSGVLFMRLDRMREFGFEEKIQNLLLNTTYHSRLAFPEQDLLNILFYKNISILDWLNLKKINFLILIIVN